MAELFAGAAKVRITPPADRMPAAYLIPDIWFGGVYQDTFVRALVFESRQRRMAILTFDSADLGRAADIRTAVSRECGLAPEYIFCAATHCHSAPMFADDHESMIGTTPERYAWVRWYGDYVIQKAVECVRCAASSMRPARYGFGTGKSYINVNRDQQFEDGSWDTGSNFARPSDKTLAVLKFEDERGGLIAALLNYAVHGAACCGGKDEKGQNFLISGDLPGMTCEYLEDKYRDSGAVCLWTSGAAGNQNTIYMSITRRFAGPPPTGPEDMIEIGYPIWALCRQLAQIHGADAVHVIDSIRDMRDAVSISVAEKTVALPAQWAYRKRQAGRGVPEDAEDGTVELKLKLVCLDDIMFLGLNGEIVCEIGMRLKALAPPDHLVIVEHTDRRAGYLPDAWGIAHRTFEYYSCDVKGDCAEALLTSAVTELIAERSKREDAT